MKKFISISAILLMLLSLAGCKNSLLNDEKSNFGSITVSTSGSREFDTKTITSAKIIVSGNGINEGSEPTETVSIANGKNTSSIVINGIPTGKNRVISVYAFVGDSQADENQVILRAVTDIAFGDNGTIAVNRKTTAVGNVFFYLYELGYDLSKITLAEKDSIEESVDAGYDYLKINSAAIANDFIANGVSGLKESSKYINGIGGTVASGITVHAKDYKYIWYWADGASGKLAELEADAEKGTGWYKIHFEEDTMNMIFRKNGGSDWSGKTDDLKRSKGDWYYENGEWSGSAVSDDSAPVVSWKYPQNGAEVTGCVHFIVDAADEDSGISVVEFYVDGVLSATTEGSYSYTFDTSDMANGSHKVYAVVKNGSKLEAKTSEITITTKNPEKAPKVSVATTKSCTETISTTFDASKSTGSISEYNWDFGDGEKGTGAVVSHVYSKAGNYTAVVIVKTPGGLTDTASIQVTVSEKGSFIHRDFREETVYFMMTDRFADGDKTNNNLWGDEYLPNGESQMYDYSEDKTGILTYYHGGDFKGIIDNLDYLIDMGFTAIWITPSVKQPEGRYYYDGSNGGDAYQASAFHGYWGYDFDQIDPHLHSSGKNSDGWDDYKAFINACHEKGIRVMQDIVLNHGNHTAATAPTLWYKNPVQTIMDGREWAWITKDPYYEAVGTGETPSKNGFYSYYGFGQCADLIDFGHLGEDGKDSRQHLINVYKKFIDAGVDAFRIDTMAYIPSEFAGEFADTMYNYAKEKGNDYFYMVGEAWCGRYTAVERHAHDRTDSLHMLDMQLSCMDYPGEMQVAFQNNGDGFNSRWNNVMASSNVKVDGRDIMTGDEWTKTAMFVDNHDVYRDEAVFSETQFKNALNYIYLFRGVPIVYYGTEAYYSWDGTHPSTNKDDIVARWMLGERGINYVKNNKPAMYKHLKMLNKIHAESEIVKYGEQTNIALGGNLVYTRTYNGKTGYFVNDLSGAGGSHSFDVTPGEYNLYICTGDEVTVKTMSASGATTVTAPANGFAFLDPK